MAFEPDSLGSRSTDELAALLKDMRRRAGLSGARLARRCAMSQSKISRIENGRVRPTLVDVEQILRALDAPAPLAAEVISLARMANTEWQSIRSLRRKGLERKQVELSALESSTTNFRYFLLSMITGLLSTPEYIRASLAETLVDTGRTAAMKLERQAVLYDDSKQFTFLLTEQAVRWPLVAGPALAVQIDRLASLTYLPNVRIGVIPLRGRVSVMPMDTFTVYDDSLATVETTAGVIVLRDPRDIAVHLELFSALEHLALFDENAREQLSEWAEICRG